jgi:hypothetical protein
MDASLGGSKMPDGPNGTGLESDTLRAELAEFFDLNPAARLSIRGDGKGFVVAKPWNDESLQINVSLENRPLIRALNSVYLPERILGLWHRHTALPLLHEDIADRAFSFTHEGITYKCSFGISSEELLLIAEHHRRVKVSDTNFRNLASFRLFRAGINPDPDINWIPYHFG